MNYKILYIEDNAINRYMVKKLLTSKGYDVYEAQDGLSGIEKSTELKPDLILMDLHMPGLNGYETTQKLKKIPELAHIPIVALTGYFNHDEDKKSYAAGCVGFIQKPINSKTFPDQIRQFLTQST